MKIGFIGAGKVGCTLGKYFSTNNFDVAGFYDCNSLAAKQASEVTKSRFFSSIDEITDFCDTLFLTVTDNMIGEVYSSLSKQAIKEKLLCHCSGAISAKDVFIDAEKFGAKICSVHPLFAINDCKESYRKMAGGFFAIEGCKDGVKEVSDILNKLGNPFTVIDPNNKVLYHCAASVASNLVNGLIDMSLEMLTNCGFRRDDALKALTPIMTNNIITIANNDTVNSLTGPVERCDTGTVLKHLNCFENEENREIYRLISKRLINTAKTKNPQRDYSELENLLKGAKHEKEHNSNFC